jgi:hypothetical protein
MFSYLFFHIFQESNNGMVWIEKTDKPSTNRSSPNVETGIVKGPQLQVCDIV